MSVGHPRAAPTRTGPPPALRAILKLIAVALVLAAGAAGWFAVEKLVLDGDDASAAASGLPVLGDGLPIERLETLQTWRRFQLTYASGPGIVERQSIDLDTQQIRVDFVADGRTQESETNWTGGFQRVDGGEWTPIDATHALEEQTHRLLKSGPFLLTDVVPPGALAFTTVLSEEQDGDLRVYRIALDEDRFEQQRPVDHARWIDAIGPPIERPAERTIHVRPDGYVVRLVEGRFTRSWELLPEPIEMLSPLGAG